MACQLTKTCVTVFAILATVQARGEQDDSGKDTLRFYLSKSSLVVSGKLVRLSTPLSPGMGEVGCLFGLRVDKVLKGKLPEKMPEAFFPPLDPKVDKEDDLLWARLTLFGTSALSNFKEGRRVIVFLREEKQPGGKAYFVGADPFFALQGYNVIMEEMLPRVVKEDAAK